jgi:hypothetical protein
MSEFIFLFCKMGLYGSLSPGCEKIKSDNLRTGSSTESETWVHIKWEQALLLLLLLLLLSLRINRT